ncbi:TVP38/TMEM64 family protein, partial [Staphylococcus epidermidis]
ILGVMGKEIFTIFTNPLRALIMIVLLVVLWFISKKVEKHFMGSTKE